MLVLSKKVRFILLGVGFLLMAVIALFLFSDIETWDRARMKREARAKVEALLTAVMEQEVLPPVQKILKQSEFCRTPDACVMSAAWDYFNPDPKDITFGTTANRTLSLKRDQTRERLELRFQASLETVNAREFLDRPSLSRRMNEIHAVIQLYGPEATVKQGRSDPGLRKLGLAIAGTLVGGDAIDFEKQVLEPCLKGRYRAVKFGEFEQDVIRCGVRIEPERMSAYLKRRKGEPAEEQLWYVELDVTRRHFEAGELDHPPAKIKP